MNQLEEKLSRVSASGTGIAHANDEARFYDFIKSAHLESVDYKEEDFREAISNLGWTSSLETVWGKYISERVRLAALD